MKLIVGLGNPGNQYNFTRHNSGFLALDFYFKINNFKWSEKPKLGAIWSKNNDIIFIKPQDFYNDSGVAVKNFINFYKIPIENILIICDDFNLEFGKIRYRMNGSAGGNNGLKSIISELKTSDFSRLRIGTENSELRQKIGDTDFVLSKFTIEEKTKLPEILNNVSSEIKNFIN